MKITADEYKKYIKDEYIRSYTHYQAMVLLAKQEGIDTDDVPTPEPTPQPTPTPDPEPISKDPEIVYNGASSYTLVRGENAKFSVYVNNVSSSRDYIINTSGEPTYYRCEETGNKTSVGYRLDFSITGVNYGKGAIKVYLASDKSKSITISIIIK